MELVALAQRTHSTIIYILQESKYHIVERKEDDPLLPIGDNEIAFGAMSSVDGRCHIDLLMKVSVKSHDTGVFLNVNTAPEVEIFGVFKQMYEKCKEEVDDLFTLKAGTASLH